MTLSVLPMHCASFGTSEFPGPTTIVHPNSIFADEVGVEVGDIQIERRRGAPGLDHRNDASGGAVGLDDFDAGLQFKRGEPASIR